MKTEKFHTIELPDFIFRNISNQNKHVVFSVVG